ncbi:MAG: hypothetical protein ACRDKW_11690 [Actinomycetota bacterium]
MQTAYQPPVVKGRFALLALALWAVGLIGFGPTLIREAVDANRTQRAEDATEVMYEIPEGGFAAIFPAEPTKTEQQDAEQPLVLYVSRIPGDDGDLGVAVSAWPGEAGGSAADSLRAYALAWAEAKGTLVTSSEVTVQSNPAMDMVIDTEAGRMFVRMIHVAGPEPRQYLLLTSKDPSATLKEAFNRMVTSFRLTTAQAPAAG